MKRKSQNKEVRLYKHSFGHYWTEQEAFLAKREIEKHIEISTLQIVKEERQKNKWKKWCVCEFYPEKGKNKKRK